MDPLSNLLVAAIVSPLARELIGRFSLVPTLCGVYLFAAFMFTLKACATCWSTEETAQGKVRLDETRDHSVLDILRGYKGVFYRVEAAAARCLGQQGKLS